MLPNRPTHHRDRTDRVIQAASWLGALAMFAYGACLSFDVLHHIAQAAGLSPRLAWAWPLGFEAFMAVAAVAVLAEQRARPGHTPWYPWTRRACQPTTWSFHRRNTEVCSTPPGQVIWQRVLTALAAAAPSR